MRGHTAEDGSSRAIISQSGETGARGRSRVRNQTNQRVEYPRNEAMEIGRPIPCSRSHTVSGTSITFPLQPRDGGFPESILAKGSPPMIESISQLVPKSDQGTMNFPDRNCHNTGVRSIQGHMYHPDQKMPNGDQFFHPSLTIQLQMDLCCHPQGQPNWPLGP